MKRSHFTIIPTIVYSNSQDPDDIKCAYRLGANAYHVKPTGMEGLCEQLRTIYNYWMRAELPETDENGVLLSTDCKGKLSESFRHPVLFPDEG